MNEGEWNEGFVRLKSGVERRRMKENNMLFVCAFEVNERIEEEWNEGLCVWTKSGMEWRNEGEQKLKG